MSIQLATCAIKSLTLGPEGQPPKRLCLVPPPVDGKIKGKDGRAWRHNDPFGLLQAIRLRPNPLVIDENHAHEIAKASGAPAPALARVPAESLSLNADGSIWGEPEWTTYGKERLSQGAYLGVSPAFLYDSAKAGEDVQGDIIGLSSAGLVNEPNLNLPVALNAVANQKDNTMDLEKLRTLLGLPESATEAEVLSKVEAVAQPQLQVQEVGANAVEDKPQAAPAAEEMPDWARH